MKLKLADLSCEEFGFRTSGALPVVVSLKDISNGAGSLEFVEELTIINKLAIRDLFALIEIPLKGGKLYTEKYATVSFVTCDGRIRNGFAGEVRASILDAHETHLDLETLKVAGHLMAEGLFVRIDGRGGRVEVSGLTLNDVHAVIGDFQVSVEVLSVGGLKVYWEGGTVGVEAVKAHARGIHLQKEGTAIDIEAIDFPKGFRIHDRVEIEEVLVGALEIAVEELSGKPSEEAVDGEDTAVDLIRDEESPMGTSIPMRGIELDHNVFDTINGEVAVDVTLSLSLPVIGKRVATHHFRIPIEGGMLNYRDFEKGLADLEDAFLDIRVRGNCLVLERDIPIIPGLNKAIVTWDLNQGELALAKQHLVRVGTIPKFRLASTTDEDDGGKKSSLKLHRLDFDNISVHLSLDETAVLRGGDGSLRVHVDSLDLAGSLHHAPVASDDHRPTAFAAQATGLGTVAHQLRVSGDRELSGNLLVGRIERLQLGFDGFRPTKLTAAIKNVAVNSFVFDLHEQR